MSLRSDLEAQPRNFDLLKVLREFERSEPNKPRIGDNAVVAEEIVALDQDPFVEYAPFNITGVEKTSHAP